MRTIPNLWSFTLRSRVIPTRVRRLGAALPPSRTAPMRVFPCLGLATVIALSGPGARVGAQSALPPRAFVPGELIVKYRTGAVPAAQGRARAKVAVAAVKELARAAAARGHGRVELIKLA